MKNIILQVLCAVESLLWDSLAKEIGFDFVDTDRWISDKANMTVGDIFKEKGELFQKFRNPNYKRVLWNIR